MERLKRHAIGTLFLPDRPVVLLGKAPQQLLRGVFPEMNWTLVLEAIVIQFIGCALLDQKTNVNWETLSIQLISIDNKNQCRS